jgi:hypothetical protein
VRLIIIEDTTTTVLGLVWQSEQPLPLLPARPLRTTVIIMGLRIITGLILITARGIIMVTARIITVTAAIITVMAGIITVVANGYMSIAIGGMTDIITAIVNVTEAFAGFAKIIPGCLRDDRLSVG